MAFRDRSLGAIGALVPPWPYRPTRSHPLAYRAQCAMCGNRCIISVSMPSFKFIHLHTPHCAHRYYFPCIRWIQVPLTMALKGQLAIALRTGRNIALQVGPLAQDLPPISYSESEGGLLPTNSMLGTILDVACSCPRAKAW